MQPIPELNHLNNFANGEKTPIPYPNTFKLQLQELYDADLVEKLIYDEKPRGQNLTDLPVNNQLFTILQIVPCKDAKANENGDLAFIKIRGGSFATAEEAEEAAKKIVETQDQLSKNYIVPIGFPLPVRKEIKTKTKLVELPDSCMDKASIEWRHMLYKEKKDDDTIRQVIENRAKNFQKSVDEQSVLELNEENKLDRKIVVNRYKAAVLKMNNWIQRYEKIKNDMVRLQQNSRIFKKWYNKKM
jgi:hypothetical protein